MSRWRAGLWPGWLSPLGLRGSHLQAGIILANLALFPKMGKIREVMDAIHPDMQETEADENPVRGQPGLHS